MKILYLPDPEYLSNEVLGSIAKVAKDDENIFLRTWESKPCDVPSGFSRIVTLNREVMEVFQILLERRNLRVFSVIQMMRKLFLEYLDLLKPDAIVVTSDMGGIINRIANKWATKNDIPFFIMQPSFLEVSPIALYEKVKLKAKYVLLNKVFNLDLAARQTVYGCENPKNHLLVWGKDQLCQVHKTRIHSKCYCVGNPVFDKYANTMVSKYIENPLVLICTQNYIALEQMGLLTSDQAMGLYGMIYDIIKRNPKTQFIIKPHPSENMEFYDNLLSGLKNKIIVNGKYHDICMGADIQVSMASYTSFEAVVLGVPIITLHPEYMESFFHQFDGIDYQARSVKEFNDCLSQLSLETYRSLFEQERLRYLNKKLDYFGYSANHIVKLIHAVVKCSKV